ncbi:MAG: dethiobiotin synthase [Nitrosomonadales bacterium]|nr:dethiobiotin synthase [Nitrosomonadales bacterium]
MSYFVTGTDTDVGKTLIACALLHAFAAKGRRVIGMKPVAAGLDDDGRNDDVVALRAASNISATPGQINPYSFYPAAAPHLAAKHVGVRIELARITTSYHELAGQADVVIVEGAGGFRVPLNDTQDSADLALELGLPVILVVGMRLGCLNHALLTAEAINARGLKLAGWVANCVTPDMPFLNENVEALQQRIDAPLLGRVSHQTLLDARLAALELDLTSCEKK